MGIIVKNSEIFRNKRENIKDKSNEVIFKNKNGGNQMVQNSNKQSITDMVDCRDLICIKRHWLCQIAQYSVLTRGS